jgi:hypothetical protein
MDNDPVFTSLEVAARAARWPQSELTAALDLALFERRPGADGWVIPLADVALLLLARRTCELIGRSPSVRALSLWRSALDRCDRAPGLLVVQQGGIAVRAADVLAGDGRPVLAVSVPALMAQARAVAGRSG